jgi:hypothetical protein
MTPLLWALTNSSVALLAYKRSGLKLINESFQHGFSCSNSA